jgi:hypothetical protein
MPDEAESVLMRHQRGQMGAGKTRDDLDHETGKTPFEEHCLPQFTCLDNPHLENRHHQLSEEPDERPDGIELIELRRTFGR